MAEKFFRGKKRARKAPYLTRVRDYMEANMPPEQRFCVLCGGEPLFMGAGLVDGVRIGYYLCEACCSPGWIARITAKVRGDMFLRRRN